jgi:hypothetical protein
MTAMHSVLEVAKACGLNPAKVCELAYDHGVPICFDVTGQASEPAYPRQEGKPTRAPEPAGCLALPRRTEEARALPAGDKSYSADAIAIALHRTGTVYLCRVRDLEKGVHLEALQATIAAMDWPADDVSDDESAAVCDEEREARAAAGVLNRVLNAPATVAVDWWTALGLSGPDAWVVDPRRRVPIARDEAATVLVGDLHFTPEGREALLRAIGRLDLLGAPPLGTELPVWAPWPAIADALDADHPRYAPDLAAALKVWIEVHRPEPSSTLAARAVEARKIASAFIGLKTLGRRDRIVAVACPSKSKRTGESKP